MWHAVWLKKEYTPLRDVQDISIILLAPTDANVQSKTSLTFYE